MIYRREISVGWCILNLALLIGFLSQLICLQVISYYLCTNYYKNKSTMINKQSQQKIYQLLIINNMDNQGLELSPQELLKHAKKHPHSVNISTQAFSVSQKDYVVHNISLKSDPTHDFEVINYRRGLTFIQEIVDFKEQGLRVAKKGLRKFYDLIPEFLDQKLSHLTNSKHYASIKSKIIDPLKIQSESYRIYSTQKANGENVQISWDQQGKFWVIGSKNKTLLLATQKDGKYITHKYEHVRTLSIADQWFLFLQSNPDKVEAIKQKLCKYVLVGEICDSVKSGHIVDYGEEVKLYFYALVSKTQRDYSCQPPSQFLQFMKQSGLEKYTVKFTTTTVNSFESLMEELKKEMYKVYEGQLSVYGEGTVVYVTAIRNSEQVCQSVCKIKTLEYRIYRKLRQKLKVYFQKYRKTYQKILHKYIEEVKQLSKGFHLPKPEQYYFNIARRAFEFCEDQQKAITKFFHNKFISFLKLVQNEKIDKQAFKKIVRQDIGNAEIADILQNEDKKQKQSNAENNGKIQEKLEGDNKNSTLKKKVIVLLPMTIPATGKSTLCKKVMGELKQQIYMQILSSDTIRAIRMEELMKKQKNLSKQSAYQKTRDSANNQYYKELHEILKRMNDLSNYQNCILFLDKNHPENALKKTIQQIKRSADKFPNISVKIVCVLPQCDKLLMNKPKYIYPFSSSYIACCLKRVALRPEHETLQGTELHRSGIVMGFANMFRNFSVSNYNLSKYFDYAIRLPFTKEQQIPQKIQQLVTKVLLGTKPGSFDQHPALEQLLEAVKQWKSEQIDLNEENMQRVKKIFFEAFEEFDNLKVDVTKFGVEGLQKQK